MKRWSDSKLADKIRGTSQPVSETAEGWKLWEQTVRQKHPFRYWLTETVFDAIQDFIYYPINKLYDIKYWFINRFVTKTHSLNSRLKKGEWHEFEERVIYCLFDELVDFVEVEKSWKNIICDEEAAKLYNAPWYSSGWFNLRSWRCPEAGLSYLDWESQLIKDESWGLEKDDPEYGKPTHQSIAAQEISNLYFWWKYERPNRQDPYEASGWSQYCDDKRKESDHFWDYFSTEKETPEEKENVRKMLDLQNKIEEEYDQEDERQLIRLIKIRKSLWT